MSSFEPAVSVVLTHEGGYANNRKDPGGETMRGISMAFIRTQGLTAQDLGVPDLSQGSLKQLTVETAKALYRRYFWLPAYEAINDQRVATKVFDAAVNMGAYAAHVLAQVAANDNGQQLLADGVLGPASIQAINSVNPHAFLVAMGQRMVEHYKAIADAHPQEKVFLHDWLRRASWMG